MSESLKDLVSLIVFRMFLVITNIVMAGLRTVNNFLVPSRPDQVATSNRTNRNQLLKCHPLTRTTYVFRGSRLKNTEDEISAELIIKFKLIMRINNPVTSTCPGSCRNFLSSRKINPYYFCGISTEDMKK